MHRREQPVEFASLIPPILRLFCARMDVCIVWRVVLPCQNDGWTPLLIASQSGHISVVRALVEAGAAVDQAAVGSL